MDQFESIQEIQIFPSFLSGWKGFSGILLVLGVECYTVSVAYKLNHEEVNSSYDCAALDVAFLNQNTFGDKTLRDEIIGLFLAQLDSIQKNFVTPFDATSWYFLTHTLKGAAAAVGARQIFKLAENWGQRPLPASAQFRLDYQQQLQQLAMSFKATAAQL